MITKTHIPRIGFLLVHERMLEAFINARDRFLKSGGLVMPSRGDIFAQPITDGQLWQEQEAKASFWRSQDFHGVDLSALHDAALDEYFGQAVVGYYPPEAAVDLGVPLCRGAFTPSTRVVSRNDGSGWFLFRF